MKLRGGNYLMLVSLAILILLAIFACSPEGGSTTPGQPSAATNNGVSNEPGTIKSWQGTETTKTEIFTITRDSWEIRWSNDPQITSGTDETLFQVYVHDVKLGTFPIYIAADTKKKDSGTYEVNASGRFYLQIDAINTKWSVEVIQK